MVEEKGETLASPYRVMEGVVRSRQPRRSTLRSVAAAIVVAIVAAVAVFVVVVVPCDDGGTFNPISSSDDKEDDDNSRSRLLADECDEERRASQVVVHRTPKTAPPAPPQGDAMFAAATIVTPMTARSHHSPRHPPAVISPLTCAAHATSHQVSHRRRQPTPMRQRRRRVCAVPPAPADAPRLANAALEAGENLGRAMVRGRRKEKGEARGEECWQGATGERCVTLLNILSRNMCRSVRRVQGLLRIIFVISGHISLHTP